MDSKSFLANPSYNYTLNHLNSDNVKSEILNELEIKTEEINTNLYSLVEVAEVKDENNSSSDSDCDIIEVNDSNDDEVNDNELPIIIQSNSGVKFKCKICDKMFEKKNYHRRHVKRHRDNKKKCYICNKYLVKLAEHMKSHFERHYECSVCGKKFPSEPRLHRHEKIHIKSLQEKCKVCNKYFVHMNQHMKHHSGKLICTKCNLKLSTHEVCPEHGKEYLNELLIECPVCKKKVRSLKRHMLYHSEKTLSCRYCDMKFNSSYNLSRHEPIHRPDLYELCNICHKSVPNLTKHMRSHPTELFECDICKATFKRVDHLRRHKKNNVCFKRNSSVPDSKKKFKCTNCPKKFTTKGNLKRHEETHDEPTSTENEETDDETSDYQCEDTENEEDEIPLKYLSHINEPFIKLDEYN